MSKRKRLFFPEDEKEYQKDLETENKEWEVMKLYEEAVSKGYTPDNDNKISVVDPSGKYKIEFRAIKGGKVHKVVMKDIDNNIEKHYFILNNQRHGLYMEIKNKEVIKIGNYIHDILRS